MPTPMIDQISTVVGATGADAMRDYWCNANIWSRARHMFAAV